MYFKQILTPGLGCYSYVIGSPQAGEAVVVDPKRDIADYLEIAREEGLRLAHVIETHLHADHVSGAMELVAATGAAVYIHPGAGVEYPHKALADGEILTMGAVRLEALHTPGHTPNSLSLLVSDLDRCETPALLLTGDVLFVGDIGRPDLPGEQILQLQVQNLYDSLYVKFGRLPPDLEVYPGHGQGSLCGRTMSDKGVTTLGYERRANKMLGLPSFEAFKEAVLARLPDRPKSFDRIPEINRQGAPLLERCPRYREISPEGFETLMSEPKAVVIDTRDASAFGGAHIPGSLNIGFEKQLANWVGMSVEPDANILIVATDRQQFMDMTVELHRIGYDNILGYLAGGMAAWIRSGRPIDSLGQMSVHELAAALARPNPPVLLDVRTPGEWEAGHIAAASHHPFAETLASGMNLCFKDPVAVICGSGYRSNISGSALAAKGCQVRAVAGGMTAWRRLGLPVVA